MNRVNLQEVDRAEVTILVDNYTDLLLIQGSKVVKRPAIPPPHAFLAEHGFSCLLKTVHGSKENLLLMDVGISGTCLLHNAELLKVDLSKVEALILSHGHFDHFFALNKILDKVPKGIPLILHPEAFLNRRLNIAPLGIQVPLPSLQENWLKEAGLEVRKIKEDSLLASNHVLVLGEVERVIEFEKGFPWAEAEVNGKWVKDPFPDDRGVAIKVKNKGLVVIGGCSHAGIINTVKHAQKVTGTDEVHGVLGGFHLTGPIFDPIIKPTIEEMKKIGPQFVVPTHCTGWKAINEFAREMPEQFLLNSVGTTYVFEAA
jgi:7,8-dihydropterin-6-yl-methyl-4-(beta-D-ribofuranosyl)aminobenzene 5'-phosphate synthase